MNKKSHGHIVGATLCRQSTLRRAGREGHVIRSLVAQNVREPLERIVENATPSEGIYYCLRNPDGWAPFSYRFDQFHEIDHTELWEQYVIPVLATRWSRVLNLPPQRLKIELNLAAYGFPRGRVVRNLAMHYVVAHGNDKPQSISRKTIHRLFSLPAGVKWETDEHEQCQIEARDTLRRLFRLKDTWPAV